MFIGTCDDANWAYEYLGEAVVERQVPGDGQKAHGGDIETEEVKVVKLRVTTGKDENPLIDLALNHPEPHVRIAAIKKIVNPAVLTSIITKDEEDKEVKKACLDRLDELYIE